MPAQEASPVGVITAHVDATWRAPRMVLIERPLHATLERQPPGVPDLAFELAHGQAYATIRHAILCQSRRIPPARCDYPSANPHPRPLESCSGWFGSHQRVADSSAGQQEAAESPTRGAPARAFGEQAKPQDPVLILATFLFALSTTYGSDGGGKKLLRRRRIGCHRIAPLLQSGDRLNAAQPEIRDAERLSLRQNGWYGVRSGEALSQGKRTGRMVEVIRHSVGGLERNRFPPSRVETNVQESRLL